MLAAETIPTLVKDYQTKVYEVRLKVAYSTLSQAFKHIVSEHGNIEGVTSSRQELTDAFSKYISHIKKCDMFGAPKTYEECFTRICYNLHGDIIDISDAIGNAFLTTGGEAYLFVKPKSDCSNTGYQIDGVGMQCAIIRVDINGFNGPNIFGRDIHQFRLTKNGIVPSGSYYDNDSDWNEKCNPDSSASSENGEGCASRVIQGGMDY